MQGMNTQTAVQPLAPGRQVTLLPEMVVQMLLNAKAHVVSKDQHTITFEGEGTLLHSRDFEVVRKVVDKMRPRLPKQLTAGTILSVLREAQSEVRQAVFWPGVVNVLYYPVQTPGSAFYRCVLPALALNRGTAVRAHLSHHRIPAEALNYDVIVFQIDHSPHTRAFTQNLQNMGKKVVFEIDDAFAHLSPTQPQYAGYSTPERQAEVRAMMQQADAVTVSTNALRDLYEKDCRRIAVIPNMIDVPLWPRAIPHRTGQFRVLWAGSPSHDDDLAMIYHALERFSTQSTGIHFIFFGSAPQGLAIPARNVKVLPFASFVDYPDLLAGVQADVALAPLVPSTFNRCKSNVKALEYMATGYPVIASNVEPYQFICNGKDGMLFKNPEELLSMLQVAYNNRAAMGKIREAAFQTVQQYDTSVRRAKIEEFFGSLMET
jgi:glycosyltransferase involved in cell wall biosynthesis